jgi:hypothetical protein
MIDKVPSVERARLVRHDEPSNLWLQRTIRCATRR